MVLGGFSIGGSMTSYLACAAPEAFDAYLPVSGGFWRPHPTECVGPVRLLHTHGWTDTTVPLEGCVVRVEDINDPNGFVQGDIFYTLGMWCEAGLGTAVHQSLRWNLHCFQAAIVSQKAGLIWRLIGSKAYKFIRQASPLCLRWQSG